MGLRIKVYAKSIENDLDELKGLLLAVQKITIPKNKSNMVGEKVSNHVRIIWLNEILDFERFVDCIQYSWNRADSSLHVTNLHFSQQ